LIIIDFSQLSSISVLVSTFAKIFKRWVFKTYEKFLHDFSPRAATSVPIFSSSFVIRKLRWGIQFKILSIINVIPKDHIAAAHIPTNWYKSWLYYIKYYV
jgi:hypothetical protein